MNKQIGAPHIAWGLAFLVAAVGVAQAQQAQTPKAAPTAPAAPAPAPAAVPAAAVPPAAANADAPAHADPAAERQYGVCVHCHGVHGEGRPELGAPRIGDLQADYITARLKTFQQQGGHIAGPKADDRLALLATFVAARTPEHRSPGEKNAAGEALYAACATCHGPDARGKPELKAPDLLFQDSAYLAMQLRTYREKKRGGEGAAPLATAMAAFVASYTDEQIEAVTAHIASLRPERPALNNYDVTLPEADGLKAFADIYKVATHPRCMNCHPEGDRPLHTDNSVPHDFDVTRFTPFTGVHCATCHPAAPVGNGLAPLPPSDPVWSLAPKQMVFQNRTPKQLCEQLKDPERNGGRGHVDSTAHIADDHLLLTSWHSGREPPPVSHEELVKRFETWGRAGGPCPPK